MKACGADLAPMVLGESFQLWMNYVFGQKSFRGVHQLACLELDLYEYEKTKQFCGYVTIISFFAINFTLNIFSLKNFEFLFCYKYEYIQL